MGRCREQIHKPGGWLPGLGWRQHLRVISIYMVFEVMNLDEVIKGMNTNREEYLRGTPTLRSWGE